MLFQLALGDRLFANRVFRKHDDAVFHFDPQQMAIAVAQVHLAYPTPPKTNQADDLHGVKVADPYRTLENADAEATKKFVAQENELTFAWLAKLPGRDAMKARLTSLWDFEKFTGLYHAG